MVAVEEVEARLRRGIEGLVHVEVQDLTGTQDHYQATVVATAFAGKSRVQQHQLVYQALGELMQGPVHALALQTYAPEVWQTEGDKSDG
ncbi:MAG: BolA/IbaG family iron-sulfur metabolism protein [Polyangiales bacterium]